MTYIYYIISVDIWCNWKLVLDPFEAQQGGEGWSGPRFWNTRTWRGIKSFWFLFIDVIIWGFFYDHCKTHYHKIDPFFFTFLVGFLWKFPTNENLFCAFKIKLTWPSSTNQMGQIPSRYWPGSHFFSRTAQVQSGAPRGFPKPDRSCDTAWSWPWPPPFPPVWPPPPARGHSPVSFGPSHRRVTHRWFHGQWWQVRPRRCDQCRCRSPHSCLCCPAGETRPLV